MLLRTLTIVLDVWTREDVSTIEKCRLFFGFLRAKLHSGNTIRFLGYVIRTDSRANGFGILKEIFLGGEYVFKTDTDAPRIIDAGGNVGMATIFFKRYFPKAHVTVFEAASGNFKHLQENIDRNNLKNVRPIFCMLGKEEGKTSSFYFNAGNPGSSTSVAEVVESRVHSTFTKEEVPTVRLSSYINDEIDLLKMDIEGAELGILEDLEQSGKIPRIRQMVFEFHYNESNPKNKLTDVLALLERNGFQTAIYDNERGSLGREMTASPIYHFMIRAYRKEL